MNDIERFIYGFFGSIIVEIILIYRIKYAGNPLPAYYKDPFFWLVRLVLAAIGGGFAIAYDVDKPLLAFHIGASFPLIVKRMEREPPTI